MTTPAEPGSYLAARRGTVRRGTVRRPPAAPLPVMLVGAGRRGLGAYLPALAAIGSLRLAAIVETPERITQLRAAPEISAAMYDSIAAGVAIARPALAIVATPHDYHVPLTLDLLRAGIPTLLEKPPARNGQEFSQLIQASAEYQTPLATALPLRHQNRYRRFMSILRSPELTDADVTIAADVPSFPGVGSWRHSRERAGGGVMIDLGYHYLELLVSCLGVPDSSSVRLSGSTGPPGAGVEDEASVVMRFAARGLCINLRLRSGLALTKRTEMNITKHGQTRFAAREGRIPATGAAPASGSMSLQPTATALQLTMLQDTGFLEGHGSWHATLVKQRHVISLIDHLYAVGDPVAGVPERTLV